MRTKLFILTIISLLAVNFVYSDEQPQTKPGSSDELNTKIERWIDDLFSEDYVTKDKAIWRLYKSGEAAVPHLVSRLKEINYDPFNDHNRYKRKDSDKVIKILGTIGEAAYPTILEMLKDDNLTMRAFGLEILYENRKVPAEFIVPILDTVNYDFEKVENRDDDLELDFVEDFVSETLYRAVYKDLDRLISYLNNPNKFIRYAVLYTLKEYLFDEDLIPFVIQIMLRLLGDEFHLNREYALILLNNIDKKYKSEKYMKIKSILPLMTDPNEEVRDCACYVISDLNCNEILTEIVKLLKNELPDVRKNAAYVLKNRGNSSVVPQLLKALYDEESEVQREVEQALDNLVDSSSIPEIKKLLSEEETYYKKIALELLLKLKDRTIIDNAEKYFNETYKIREILAKSIAVFEDKEHIPILIKLMDDKYRNVKFMAVWALGELGEKSEKVLEALRKALDSTDNNFLISVIEAIKKLGDKAFVKELTKLVMRSGSQDLQYFEKMRKAALEAIVKFQGEKSIKILRRVMNDYFTNEALSTIIELVKTFDDKTKSENNPTFEFYENAIMYGNDTNAYRASKALGDRKTKQITKTLTEMLKYDTSPYKRELAARMLANNPDKSSLPLFIKGLEDEDESVRNICVDAITEIGDKSAVKHLLSFLNDEDYQCRKHILEALCKLDGKNQIDKLLSALNDEEKNIREFALNKITEIADNPDELLNKFFDKSEITLTKLMVAQHLIKTLDDYKKYADYILGFLNSSEVEYQNYAISYVGQIKEKSIVPELLKFLENDSIKNYAFVIDALGEIGDKSAVPKLLEILDDCYRSYSRSSAALALGKIGDKSVFEQLVKSLQDDIDGWDVRSSCAKALGDLSDKRAIPYLIEALDDVFTLSGHIIYSVKCESIIALGKLKATEALDKLREIVKKYENKYYGSCYDMYPSHLAYQAKIAIKLIEGKE